MLAVMPVVFPGYEHDGPFSELAQRIPVEQDVMVKMRLGMDFFARKRACLSVGGAKDTKSSMTWSTILVHFSRQTLHR